MANPKVANPSVFSMYWDNIDASVLTSQEAVFRKLGVTLHQMNVGDEHHGDWMTRMANEIEDDVIFFCDIDAFPLTRKVYEDAVAIARNGGIFGVAQVANHLDPSKIYAAPSFLAFSRETYRRLGCPSLKHSKSFHPAQLLTEKAQELDVPLHLLFPRTFLIPKWPLANLGIYGIGTFYGENEIFHLFQSRFSKHVKIFNAVGEDVVSGQLEFERYLRLAQIAMEPKSWKQQWNAAKLWFSRKL